MEKILNIVLLIVLIVEIYWAYRKLYIYKVINKKQLMTIIKTQEELDELTNDYSDLYIEDDVRIEFEPIKGSIRNIVCWDLSMQKGDELFDLYCINVICANFIGKYVSYQSFFNCYKTMQREDWEMRNCFGKDPVALGGITPTPEKTIEVNGHTYKLVD